MKNLLLVVLFICSTTQLFADKWDNNTAELRGKKILVFTKNGEGYVHDNIQANVNMFLRLGAQYDFKVDSTSNSALFSTPDLFQYDAIVFANTNNKVFENEEEKEGLVRFNRQGKGIVGIHIACGTEPDWDWFKQMIGGTFDFHPQFQKFNVRVVDDRHPSARDIPPVWEVEDELYILKEMNPTVRVLMVSDSSSPGFQHSKSNPMPNTFGSLFPSVWCNEFDGGRQWVTALGHKKEDYSNPLFINHIIGGLQWVLAKKESQVSTAGKGQWISFDNPQTVPNTWMIFRKDIVLDKVPPQLIAKIAVDSKYWLWINDQLVVFEGGLKRGPARNATYYDEVEISPYLTKGDNTIAVLVWHFGKNSFSHANSGVCGLFFEAISPTVEILSDRTWRGSVYQAYGNTEPPFPNYRLSESNIRFDARKAIWDWNKKAFDGRLSPVSLVDNLTDTPLGQLVKRPIPLWKDWGLSNYPDMRQSGDTLKCSLPYNCHITPYLKVKAAAGQTIHLLTDNYTGGSANNVRAEYITCEGEQEYESLGWMNGHEVWYIIPQGVEVLELKYRETGYDTEFSGSFRCNDELLNELWKRSARTLYVTMRDTYMDCPDRERAQWWGDVVNELGESFYSLSPSSHQLALKGIHELMNWQRSDGVIFSPCPAGSRNQELPLQMLASVGWYGFHTQYYYSADSSFVPVVYDRVRRYLHDVWKTDSNGLVVERNGDWSWGDWGQNVDLGVLTNCWYYLALKAEHAFALQLGKAEDARQAASMMQKIKENFDSRFWTGSAYRSPGYKGETDDRSQAMAVVSGLASKDKYPALLKILQEEYHASPYMEKYVLEALFVMDEPAFALERMKKRYSSMLKYTQYTTLFEGWGIGAEGFGGGSINHAWSGGPLTLLSQKVCGVEPTSPGFKTFRVSPQMGTLTEAEASFESVNGEIRVAVTRSGKKYTIRLTVPENSSAEVVFPNGKAVVVQSGNHILHSAR